MPEYRIRLVAEAGLDPVDGTPRHREEQTLSLDADSPWEARCIAVRRMTLRPMGRVLNAYDADTGEEVKAPPPPGLRPGRFVIRSARDLFRPLF